MDLDKLEAYAKHGDMGPYSAQFVELIALIRKQEAALQAATTQEIRAVASSSAPSVATVDTPEFYGRITCCILAPNAEKDEEIAGLIVHIDAHVAAQVAAKDAEIARLAAKVSEMDTWLGQRPCRRDRCAEYAALSAQAAAPMADSGNDVTVRNVLNSKRQAWECKIGVVAGVEIPRGGDAPMRRAVEKAFFELTGQEPDANFSGWGATFNSAELAVINHQSGGGKQ